MLQNLLRSISRALFILNIDANHLITQNQHQQTWKDTLVNIQNKQQISILSLSQTLNFTPQNFLNLNNQLNDLISSLPPQLANLFFSAQKCSNCQEIIKKFTFLFPAGSITQHTSCITHCTSCNSILETLTPPSILLIVGSGHTNQTPCTLSAFSHTFLLSNVIFQNSNFLLNESALKEEEICKFGEIYKEKPIGKYKAQRLLFGGEQFSFGLFVKGSEIEIEMREKLFSVAELIDEKEAVKTAENHEITIIPQVSERNLGVESGVEIPKEISIFGSNVPKFLLIFFAILTFLAAFNFFGLIAIFGEIGKAKKRIL